MAVGVSRARPFDKIRQVIQHGCLQFVLINGVLLPAGGPGYQGVQKTENVGNNAQSTEQTG